MPEFDDPPGVADDRRRRPRDGARARRAGLLRHRRLVVGRRRLGHHVRRLLRRDPVGLQPDVVQPGDPRLPGLDHAHHRARRTCATTCFGARSSQPTADYEPAPAEPEPPARPDAWINVGETDPTRPHLDRPTTSTASCTTATAATSSRAGTSSSPAGRPRRLAGDPRRHDPRARTSTAGSTAPACSPGTSTTGAARTCCSAATAPTTTPTACRWTSRSGTTTTTPRRSLST